MKKNILVCGLSRALLKSVEDQLPGESFYFLEMNNPFQAIKEIQSTSYPGYSVFIIGLNKKAAKVNDVLDALAKAQLTTSVILLQKGDFSTNQRENAGITTTLSLPLNLDEIKNTIIRLSSEQSSSVSEKRNSSLPCPRCWEKYKHGAAGKLTESFPLYAGGGFFTFLNFAVVPLWLAGTYLFHFNVFFHALFAAIALYAALRSFTLKKNCANIMVSPDPFPLLADAKKAAVAFDASKRGDPSKVRITSIGLECYEAWKRTIIKKKGKKRGERKIYEKKHIIISKKKDVDIRLQDNTKRKITLNLDAALPGSGALTDKNHRDFFVSGGTVSYVSKLNIAVTVGCFSFSQEIEIPVIAPEGHEFTNAHADNKENFTTQIRTALVVAAMGAASAPTGSGAGCDGCGG